MKKNVTLNIDEDVWSSIKKEVPNISEFVENYFKIYLAIESDFTVEEKEQEFIQITKKIEDLLMERYLLTQSLVKDVEGD